MYPFLGNALPSDLHTSSVRPSLTQIPEDEESPLFQSDDFRMWCMKVIPCTKRFVHDWTICPFAHSGEKAVRRDPRVHGYTGIACPDMKKSNTCIRGERCPYAHNVFEYWLHPTRYRTQLCNDGPGCKRSICFFAHNLDELRVPACKPYISPEALARASLEAIQNNPHPLGNKLPSPTADAHAAMQQAALAAMGGPASDSNPDHQFHTHVAPSVPRISTDYGSLPRWSDCQTSTLLARGSYPFMKKSTSFGDGSFGADNAKQPNIHEYFDASGASLPHSSSRFSSSGSAGDRYSYGRDSDYFSTSSLSPLRLSGGSGSSGLNPVAASVTAHFDHANISPVHAADVYYKDEFANENTVGATAAAMHEDRHSPASTSTSSPSAASTRLSHHKEEEEEEKEAAQGYQGRTSTPVVPHGDDSLAHSLASLKIALTQHTTATTNASNHDVVLSTLHQILKDAVKTHTGTTATTHTNDTTDNNINDDSSASPSLVAACGSNDDVGDDAPGRFSLEVPSVGSPHSIGGEKSESPDIDETDGVFTAPTDRVMSQGGVFTSHPFLIFE